jgi:ATP-dependent RNA helicase DeaD
MYVHRIGRTGRAGKAGIAISLVSPGERRYLRQIEAFTHQKLARVELPSEADILAHREQSLLRQMTIWLQRGRYKRERAIVEALVQDGFDPIEVAAAAMKIARADEKQRPIAPVNPVAEPSPNRPERSNRPRRPVERSGRPQDVSHEPGMVRLRLDMGRKQGLRANEVVGAIAAHARIPGSSIGKIHIQEGHALVDVPEEFVNLVLVNPKPMQIRHQRVDVQVA